MRTTFLLSLMLIGLNGISQGLPEFSFENAMAIPAKVDQSVLAPDSAVVVIYFDSHNQESLDQAREISDNMDDLKHVYFIFVCVNPRIEALTFRKLNFIEQENVFVAMDTEGKFKEWFGFDEVPTMICYDRSWNRGQVLSKFQSAETLALGVSH